MASWTTHRRRALGTASGPCALAVAIASAAAAPAPAPSAAPPDPVATFSIVAFDPETGDLGVAVESKFFGVGAVVPWAKAGVGAVATQAFANTTFGPRGLHLLEMGFPAQEALDVLVKSDPRSDRRQVGVVDAKGRPATRTGSKCNPWAGGRTGDQYAAQGNILTGKEVVDAMAAAFEGSAGRPLADRLVEALLAGQAAGGDSRGQQSAALLVVRQKGGYAGLNDRYVDLRVDDHPRPIEELERLLEIHHTVNAFADARFFMEKGDHARGVRMMEQAVARVDADPNAAGPARGGAWYDLGCFYALAGMGGKAVDALEKGFRLSPSLIPYSLTDPDLDPIRDDPRFRAMVKDAAPPKE
jgi:uncharacterized Ntn-hydrolase superfamily protein